MSKNSKTEKQIPISREWSMPNSNTFSIPPIKKIIDKYAKGKIVDPFANSSKVGTVTNDLDPQYDTDYHMDALDFLKMFEDNSVDTVLYDPPYCYDENTDLFTRSGWKNIKDITMDDEIATLSVYNNQMEWHKPEEVIKKQYKGKMYSIENRDISLLVTPNHRCLVRDNLYSNYYWTEAEKLFKKNEELFFKRSCEWEGKRIHSFYFPMNNKTIPMDVWLKFLGLYLGMGEYEDKTEENEKPMVFFEETDETMQGLIMDVMDELGYQYDFNGQFIMSTVAPLWSYVEQFTHYEDGKFVPEEIKNLPTPQLKALLDYMMIGCEHTRLIAVRKGKKRTECNNIYYTYSEQLFHDFCEMAMKCNYAIKTKEGYDKYADMPLYEVRLIDKKDFIVKSSDCKEVDFDDYVYCVRVQNASVFVKRDGKTCWCGNSPRQVSESYKKLGKSVDMQTTQASYWSKQKAEIGRIVKEDGVVITCGWNSGGIGKKYGFEQEEILLVPHGGWHNDTIVTVERKTGTTETENESV